MKRLMTVIVLGVGLLLGGCVTDEIGANLGAAFKVATSTFTNPVTLTNLYQAKVVFVATQDLVVKYQRDCFGSYAPPYPVSVAIIKADPALSIQCRHRVSRYNTMKAAEGVANNAIGRADTFIKQNPTGNAASYILAAVRAVTDYRAKAGN